MRLRILILSLVAGPVALAGDPPPEAFSSQVMAALVDHDCSEDTDAFTITCSGRVAILQNSFEHWRAAASDVERQQVVDRVIANLLRPVSSKPATWEQAAPHIRLRIRPPHWDLAMAGAWYELDEETRRAHGKPPTPTPSRDMSGVVSLHVVYDLPQAIAEVSQADLDGWGVGFDAAVEQAVTNLRAGHPRPFTEHAPGVYTARIGDDYDSARMLMIPEVQALPLQPPILALPITRHHLYFASEGDPAAVAELLRLAQAGPSTPGGFDNLTPMVLTDGAWTAWTPGPKTADEAAWSDLIMRNRGTWYAETKDVLYRKLEAEQRDIYVGSFGSVEIGSRNLSYTTWAPVHGWIPRADLVGVAKGQTPEEGMILVPWSAIEAHAAAYLKPVPGVRPVYFEYTGGVPPEVVEALEPFDVLEAGGR